MNIKVNGLLRNSNKKEKKNFYLKFYKGVVIKIKFNGLIMEAIFLMNMKFGLK